MAGGADLKCRGKSLLALASVRGHVAEIGYRDLGRSLRAKTVTRCESTKVRGMPWVITSRSMKRITGLPVAAAGLESTAAVMGRGSRLRLNAP